MENSISVHQRRFEAAVKVMRTLPADGAFEPSEYMLIRFYTFHKQATVGVCNKTQPCSRDALNKAKWEAWKALGDMSKEEAMKAYIEEILQILEMIPITEEVSDLLNMLESFYEVVEEDNNPSSKPAMTTFSGSCDEWRESSVEDVEDDMEEEDDDEDCLIDGSDVSEPEQQCGVCSDSLRAEEGLGGLRPAAAPAKKLEGRGGNTEQVDVSQEKPQGAALPPLCTVAHGSVQSVILSENLGRGCKLAVGCVAPLWNALTLNDGTLNECVVTDTDSLNTQIAVVLSWLQDDMKKVLTKLNTLEAQAISQRLSVWPSVISRISVAFLLIWPFVVHFLVQVYFKKKRTLSSSTIQLKQPKASLSITKPVLQS